MEPASAVLRPPRTVLQSALLYLTSSDPPHTR